MEKEEILEKIKNENVNGDEKDLLDRQKSYAVGYSVGTALCLILSIIESWVFKRSDTALWIVYLGTCFTVALVGLIRSKKKFLWLPLIFTAVGLIAFVFLYCLGV